MKKKLDALLKFTLDGCFKQGLIKETPLPDYVIETPNNSDHGHFATNLPLKLAPSQKKQPREIASIIIEHLRDDNNILENAEVAGPGFINFRVSAKEWYHVLSDIIALNGDYGRNELGSGEKIMIEFVSSNPTGPVHLGHGRGAALGDTLCRIFSFCGYEVAREFYINDAGQQIRLLGESILCRFKQMRNPAYQLPEKGYQGEYVLDLAGRISEKNDLNNMPEEEAIRICAGKGKEIMLEEIKEDLALFRVTFDTWYSESDLFNSGLLRDALDTIRTKGQIYNKDGALWIKTSDFGDDKDRVIQKNDGQFTYFASDIAYHLEKQRRGFTKAINIWGADHHGYVPRMRAALLANGFPENWLSVILIQLVKLWQDDQEITMSKRAGSFVTLRELVDEVGVDAVRFVLLTKNHDSTLDIDVDLVKKKDRDNPVYYVQYAHARICSIFRKASSEGIILPEKPDDVLELLVLDEEMDLIRIMAGFPSLLQDICRALEPHRLTYYLTSLATSFHRYFNLGTKAPEHRIITRNRDVTLARLSLAEAIRIVIANGLDLLGVSAPEKM
ncbi:MAG TPA: arginine--tRNA ligase [Desulfobacteraceae bacterium]|nr:arginine--tRNA ligase [Desulfobacteraceae bacterium]